MDNYLVEDAYKLYVEYHFEFENGEKNMFKVSADFLSKEQRFYSENKYDWAKLSFHKCENCPLQLSEYEYCPAAISITDIIEYFSQKVSFSRCKCSIIFPEKTVIGEKPLQDVLYSLMGLRLATSLCPFLSKFKPMARFHEPFSTPFYTVYRATSLYMLGQYYKNKKNKNAEFNFKGLKEFYTDISNVNTKIAERLRAAEVMDATPNSLIILSMFGTSINYFFDDYINILEKLFD